MTKWEQLDGLPSKYSYEQASALQVYYEDNISDLISKLDFWLPMNKYTGPQTERWLPNQLSYQPIVFFNFAVPNMLFWCLVRNMLGIDISPNWYLS